ncbi:MAG: tetraacyldisaccharide 4'-kinase, partial [Candidatus Omnitrophica bacterium]|nr:tetraacyldisaccharide 4'-kinase [Candidatus Omnitrophota bacterium]
MNGLRSAFHQVIAGRPRGAGQKLLGVFLKIASVGYGAAVGLVRAYEKSALRSRALPCPVISVGNLTWGGTGKTPFTIYLAERFLRQGIRAAVLTRGYGQDEVDLLRRQLPQVPVYVGRDRIQTGHRAIQKGAQVLILDDGFQHWRLRRDLDIVLLNAAAPFGNGWMLPGG